MRQWDGQLWLNDKDNIFLTLNYLFDLNDIHSTLKHSISNNIAILHQMTPIEMVR